MRLRNSGAHGSHASCAPRPYKSVQVRTSPYSLARTLCIAQSALPARGNVRCSLENAQHMEHGGKPHFSPCSSPLSPRVLYRGLRHAMRLFKLPRSYRFPPRREAVRLSARCHSAAPNILGAVAAPLCSDSLPSPLRARHRRASPRVLELHKDVYRISHDPRDCLPPQQCSD